MRVAIGGMYHETHTFAAQPTVLADFQGEWTEGEDLLEWHGGTGTELGGIIAGCRRRGWQIAPLVFALATPSGLVSRSACDAVAGALARRLAAAGPVDAVLLVLHGAMVAEGCDDPEGELLRQVRRLVGPGVPVVCTIDFHANLSDAMVELSDCLVAYDTYCSPFHGQMSQGPCRKGSCFSDGHRHKA